MKLFYQTQISICIVATTLLVSCMDCNTEGCDALNRPARTSDVKQGLAGVCAFPDDTAGEYLGQTCQECPLGNDRFYLWKTEQAITSAQDASAICSTSEFMYIDFEERYEVALDTGTYLACSRNMDYQNAMNCVDVLIAEGMITTLNTEHMGWTPALYLSEPGEAPVLIDNPILATCIRQ